MTARWQMISELFETINEAYQMCQLELTPWETEFIDSVEMQFSDRDNLSDKQVEILRRIEGKIG